MAEEDLVRLSAWLAQIEQHLGARERQWRRIARISTFIALFFCALALAFWIGPIWFKQKQFPNAQSDMFQMSIFLVFMSLALSLLASALRAPPAAPVATVSARALIDEKPTLLSFTHHGIRPPAHLLRHALPVRTPDGHEHRIGRADIPRGGDIRGRKQAVEHQRDLSL
jgi:hypothetical protein